MSQGKKNEVPHEAFAVVVSEGIVAIGYENSTAASFFEQMKEGRGYAGVYRIHMSRDNVVEAELLDHGKNFSFGDDAVWKLLDFFDPYFHKGKGLGTLAINSKPFEQMLVAERTGFLVTSSQKKIKERVTVRVISTVGHVAIARIWFECDRMKEKDKKRDKKTVVFFIPGARCFSKKYSFYEITLYRIGNGPLRGKSVTRPKSEELRKIANARVAHPHRKPRKKCSHGDGKVKDSWRRM